MWHYQTSNFLFCSKYPLYSAFNFSILTFYFGNMLYESFLSCSRIYFVDSEM